MSMSRCVFMGTPAIAAVVLENMIKNNIQVGLVVTQPDKKVGRKQKIVYSPVKEIAEKYGISCFQPIRIKEDFQTILDFNPDLIVTCAYGQIVPISILECPKYGCVNLHGSLLPKYRGGAPIQRAIWNGDKVTGMSLMKMAPKMDAGPVLDVEKIDILDDDNSSTIFEKLGVAASRLLIKNFDLICSNQAKYIEQDASKVTFAPIITKEEEKIDLTKDDLFIYNQIRALSLKPGAYVLLKNKKFKILKARYIKESVSSNYELVGWVHDGYGLTLKNGVLIIEQCQMEGKPIVCAKDFYNGQGRNLVGTFVE